MGGKVGEKRNILMTYRDFFPIMNLFSSRCVCVRLCAQNYTTWMVGAAMGC